LSESQDFEHLHVINDFEAVGHAVGRAARGRSQSHWLAASGAAHEPGRLRHRGRGHGPRRGRVIANAGAFTVLATEGGHASFAPTNERAIELLRWLRKKYGRVSAERVLSGAGLANLYLAHCEVEGQHVPELSAIGHHHARGERQ